MLIALTLDSNREDVPHDDGPMLYATSGRSRGGLTTKLPAPADAEGPPIAFGRTERWHVLGFGAGLMWPMRFGH